ncbi:MAG TPA: alpha/beta hydrolase [Xanthobacteraceae bacterium]|nr:alpha/beta hydrolase [Xanthobacteraceae bacterium]
MLRCWPLAVVAALLSVLASRSAVAQEENAPHHRPVKAVGDIRISVGGRGAGVLYLSADWSKPQPSITRAVIILHGVLRNADVYFKSAERAHAAAGDAGRATLMIVPQFLAQVDVDAWHLPADTLRWSLTGWEGGEPALATAPVSSFEVLDAILARLADRTLFPHLATVVVAGHSGGGQVAQRYAIATRGEAALEQAGIAIRYVVANPSSYAYFSPDRPQPAIAGSCPGYDDWKYGMQALPPYLQDRSPTALEKDYVARRVIYLLGTADTNPNHPALDKSCKGEAEGPYRYARGHAYANYMKARDQGTPNHSVWDVPGVGHDGDKMLTSACGLAALFDLPGCAGAK